MRLCDSPQASNAIHFFKHEISESEPQSLSTKDEPADLSTQGQNYFHFNHLKHV
jgi:hypothetical protein